MLKGEHSAILSTFIRLPFVIKIFVLSMLNGRLRQVLLYLKKKTPGFLEKSEVHERMKPVNKTINQCGVTRSHCSIS